MVRLFLILTSLTALHCAVVGQPWLPIIDMHMHARTAGHYGPPPQPMCAEVWSMGVWDQTKTLVDALETSPLTRKLNFYLASIVRFKVESS